MIRLTLVIGTALFSSAAIGRAADIPVSSYQPPILASGVSWTGFYLGVHGGTAVGSSHWSNPTGLIVLTQPRFPARGDNNGVLGGVTGGWNYQIGPLVLGVDADLSSTSLYGNAVCGGVFGGGGILGWSFGWTCKSEARALGTLTGRIGYAKGRTLLYLKGGAAYAKFHQKIDVFLGAGEVYKTDKSSSRLGWTIGGGVEYAIGSHWSAKAEYGFMAFRRKSFSDFNAFYDDDNGATVRQNIHVVKFGLNYHIGSFGPGSSASPIGNDVTGEFGTRIGWSRGRYQFDLFGRGDPAPLNSRLTWPGQSGLALEAFARVDYKSGLFAKGYIGGLGLFQSGQMTDEDFPPSNVPYSNTVSSTRKGNGLYGTADIGYAFLKGKAWRLSGFVGYHHYQQQLHAFGCTQTALPDNCKPAGYVPDNLLFLSRRENWHAARLGISADMMVTDNIKIAVDAAWLPHIRSKGYDNHWARPDINPEKDFGGRGRNGWQLEAVASYKVTDTLSIGVGSRHVNMSANARIFSGQSTKIKSERTTFFLQASYSFGHATAPPIIPK